MGFNVNIVKCFALVEPTEHLVGLVGDLQVHVQLGIDRKAAKEYKKIKGKSAKG